MFFKRVIQESTDCCVIRWVVVALKLKFIGVISWFKLKSEFFRRFVKLLDGQVKSTKTSSRQLFEIRAMER